MRFLIRAAGAAALVLQSLAAWDAEAAPARWSGNGHLYEVRLVSEGLNWVQAELRAYELGCGWYLATVTSKAEHDFVFGLVKKRAGIFAGVEGPWLGAFQKNDQAEPAGNWRWVTDEAFRYTRWAPGQPDDVRDDELFLNYRSGGGWNDALASLLTKGFVVEFDEARRAACRKRG
jgi:hypothetical protein